MLFNRFDVFEVTGLVVPFRAQSGQSVPIHGLDLPALCMVTSARGLEDAAVSVINVRTQMFVFESRLEA